MFRSLIGLSFVALLTAACAAVDPVDSRYDTVERSLAKARNEAIFLNLVRASHDYPLSFTTISNVTPSLTNLTNLGLPAFLFGPAAGFSTTSSTIQSLPSSSPGRDVIFGNSTASNSTSISTNFSVSTQETSTFYLGFLKPIDLQTLNYFIRQGYPRELLFWLFTDSFEVTVRGKKYGYRYDPLNSNYGCDPSDSKGRCFVDWVHIATLVGLTVEEQSVERPSAAKGGESTTAGGGSSKPATTVYARFCNNKILGDQAKAIAKANDPSLRIELINDLDVTGAELYGKYACGRLWSPPPPNEPQSDTFPLKFDAAGVTFRIIPRSAYGVFEFLGTVMKIQRENIKAAGNIPARAATLPNLISVNGDKELITIVQNDDSGVRCFSHTWFYDGDYCVPESATNTKLIFGLLAQLIAIQTAASDLSITPLVRIIQ